MLHFQWPNNCVHKFVEISELTLILLGDICDRMAALTEVRPRHEVRSNGQITVMGHKKNSSNSVTLVGTVFIISPKLALKTDVGFLRKLLYSYFPTRSIN